MFLDKLNRKERDSRVPLMLDKIGYYFLRKV